jgi:2-desacetyl-2-hydroxyethyl bacteriochlorophyllide A dehydrogenase
MRAAVFVEKEHIEIQDDYPKPAIDSNEILIKVSLCAICGTDVKNYFHQIYQTPLIMGHEFAGIIVEVGSKVTKFKVGEKITGINVLGEDYNDMRRIGIFSDGAFAEYVKIHEDFAFSFPDSTSMETISMIEIYAVAMRGLYWASFESVESVIIIGAGAVGLAMLDLLKAKYPNLKILMIEIHPLLREKALEFGADAAVPPQKGKIRKFFKEFGESSLIFDCAGTPQTVKLASEIVKQMGSIIMVGIPRDQIVLSGLLVSLKEIGLRASISHNREDIERTIKLIKKHNLHPEHLITHYSTLEQLSEKFELYKSSESRDFIKIVIRMNNG